MDRSIGSQTRTGRQFRVPECEPLARGHHGCHVWGMGGNGEGQLGDGSGVDRLSAVPVPGLEGIVQASAGTFHSLALAADGTIHTWGGNWIGDGTFENRYTPVVVSVPAPASP